MTPVFKPITTLTVLAALAFPLIAGAAGFADCPQFFVNQQPPAFKGAKLRALCFSHFAVLHNGQTRTPVFSAERLTASEIEQAKHVEREDRFFADHRLPENERAELEDYQGSGYDRGHMAPSHDQPDETAMAQSFSLANMVPQNSHNNRGPWSAFEATTRKYATLAAGPIYVISGPVFGPNPQRLNNRVAIPSQLFKLVYDPSANKAWAYWIDNTDTAQIAPPISYSELTKRIGVRLLPRGVRPGYADVEATH